MASTDQENHDRWVATGGYALGGAVVGFVVGKAANNPPLWTVVGAAGGAAVGLASQYRTSNKVTKRMEKDGVQVTTTQGKTDIEAVGSTVIKAILVWQLAVPVAVFSLGLVTLGILAR